MSIEVLAPGRLTTVQDLGREGSRALGVGCAGAADRWSHAVANLLAGNPASDATLELTLTGPTLRFTRATTIALCGADVDAQADGVVLPGWRPVALRAGATLVVGACRAGARAYLACDGGIDAATLLASRSTDLRGGFGGHEGRALRPGDNLALGAPRLPAHAADHARIAPWWIDPSEGPARIGEIAVRVLPGSDATAPIDALHAATYSVDAASNRQGLRLRGPPVQVADMRERVSEPVVPGTVQLPPDGQPIVLLCDAQTVGGYPRIGHVIAADLPLLAQRRAGDRLRFLAVGHAEARAAAIAQRNALARIALAIAARRR